MPRAAPSAPGAGTCDAGALRHFDSLRSLSAPLGSASLSARSAQGEGAFAPSPRRQRRRPSRAPGHV